MRFRCFQKKKAKPKDVVELEAKSGLLSSESRGDAPDSEAKSPSASSVASGSASGRVGSASKSGVRSDATSAASPASGRASGASGDGSPTTGSGSGSGASAASAPVRHGKKSVEEKKAGSVKERYVSDAVAKSPAPPPRRRARTADVSTESSASATADETKTLLEKEAEVRVTTKPRSGRGSAQGRRSQLADKTRSSEYDRIVAEDRRVWQERDDEQLAQALGDGDPKYQTTRRHRQHLNDSANDMAIAKQLSLFEATRAEFRIPSSLLTDPPSDNEDVVTKKRQDMKEKLALYDLDQLIISGDGNCQFASVSDQLFRSAKLHPQVRTRACNQIEQNPDTYKAFIGDEEFEAYLERMRKLKTWGDNITLQAISDAYGVAITLITNYAESDMVHITPAKKLLSRTLFLSYYADVHYNSVYPKSEIEAAKARAAAELSSSTTTSQGSLLSRTAELTSISLSASASGDESGGAEARKRRRRKRGKKAAKQRATKPATDGASSGSPLITDASSASADDSDDSASQPPARRTKATKASLHAKRSRAPSPDPPAADAGSHATGSHHHHGSGSKRPSIKEKEKAKDTETEGGATTSGGGGAATAGESGPATTSAGSAAPLSSPELSSQPSPAPSPTPSPEPSPPPVRESATSPGTRARGTGSRQRRRNSRARKGSAGEYDSA